MLLTFGASPGQAESQKSKTDSIELGDLAFGLSWPKRERQQEQGSALAAERSRQPEDARHRR